MCLLQCMISWTWEYISYFSNSLSFAGQKEGKATMGRRKERQKTQEGGTKQTRVCQYDTQRREEGSPIHANGCCLSPRSCRICVAGLVGSVRILFMWSSGGYGTSRGREVCHGHSTSQCYRISSLGTCSDCCCGRYLDPLAPNERSCYLVRSR